MTWAARYSRTEQPELTIWRDGVEVERLDPSEDDAYAFLNGPLGPWDYASRVDLREQIAARVPVTECEEPGCVHWAMPDGRCHHLHGGSDEL